MSPCAGTGLGLESLTDGGENVDDNEAERVEEEPERVEDDNEGLSLGRLGEAAASSLSGRRGLLRLVSVCQ